MMNIEMIEMRYALETQLLDAVYSGNELKAFYTLHRKKAEEAGVHPIYTDQCSNQHVQLIEQITGKEQCLMI